MRASFQAQVRLLAGGFFRRGRRSVTESQAMSLRCDDYNPPVAGRSGRGTGNLTGPEQAPNRSLSGRIRQGTGGRNEGAISARPGCKAQPGFPSPARERPAPGRRPGGRPRERPDQAGAARLLQQSSRSRRRSEETLSQPRLRWGGGRNPARPLLFARRTRLHQSNRPSGAVVRDKSLIFLVDAIGASLASTLAPKPLD